MVPFSPTESAARARGRGGDDGDQDEQRSRRRLRLGAWVPSRGSGAFGRVRRTARSPGSREPRNLSRRGPLRCPDARAARPRRRLGARRAARPGRASGAPIDHLVERALAEFLGVEHHTLYQVSTAGALVEGVYQGAVSVGVVREHGDFGLGTFEDLDGEMVVLDGHVFRVGSDGAVGEVADDARTPFAVVTRFGDPPPVTVDRGRRLRRRSPTARRAAPLRQRVLRGARRRSLRRSPRARRVPYRAGRAARGRHRDAVGVRARAGHRHHGRVLVAAVRFGRGDRRLPPALPHRRPPSVVTCSTAAAPSSRVRLQEESDVHLALPDTAAFRGADLTHDPTADLDRAEH